MVGAIALALLYAAELAPVGLVCAAAPPGALAPQLWLRRAGGDASLRGPRPGQEAKRFPVF